MKNLDELIEAKRNEMYALAAEKGFTHADTVKASQELDKLLNKKQ